MLRRKKGLRNKTIFAAMVVLKVTPLCIQKQKHNRNRKSKKRKHCRKPCIRRRKCFPIFPRPPKPCHRKRPKPRPCPSPCCVHPIHPIDPIDPVDPVDPGKQPFQVEKECCGNILIQGNQPAFQIWENDVDAHINVVQVTIYASPSSTDAIEVEMIGTESKHMVVPPGNTTNFIGHGIKSVKVSAQGNQHKYVEGKYVISITLAFHGPPGPPAPPKEQ